MYMNPNYSIFVLKIVTMKSLLIIYSFTKKKCKSFHFLPLKCWLNFFSKLFNLSNSSSSP